MAIDLSESDRSSALRWDAPSSLPDRKSLYEHETGVEFTPIHQQATRPAR
jgi:hypothetical protein